MTPDDRPDLALGEPPRRLQKRAGGVSRGWLGATLALQAALLGCMLLLLSRSGVGGRSRTASDGSTGSPLRSAALRLEEKGLDGQAARAWERYLETTPDATDAAQVLYRIGKLHMQADEYGPAASALVRAEIAAGDEKDLVAKIGPRLIECLRRLGRYGEVDRELSRRVAVGADQTGTGEPLARLAGEELTETDLDRMIESRVDQMLDARAAAGDQTQRQAILKQLSTPAMRDRLLREMLQETLLSRRARELELDREGGFEQTLRSLEDRLLAERLLAREIEKIQPTQVDLESYHQANRSNFEQPESIRVAVIPIADDENPTELVAMIESRDDFERLRAERADGAASMPAEQVLIPGRTDPLLGDAAELFGLAEGEWTKQPVERSGKRFLALVENKTAAHSPPFEEVRALVRADYVARKRKEMSERLFSDLMARYDVRILPPKDVNAAEVDPEGAGVEKRGEEERR